MKSTHILAHVAAAALLAALPVLGAIPADAQANRRTVETTTTRETTVTVETLRDKVEPMGRFVRVAQVGQAWRPADVDRDWKPYTHGRWIYNADVGWYFESDEPWAEVTYHYGRWFEDPDQGWVWVADTKWAPAWVEWRRSKRHIGWRPLPPENVRVTVRRDRSTPIREEEEWVFVPARDITAQRVSTVFVRETEVTEVYRETRPAGRVEVRGAYAVNLALRPEVLERESDVRIETRNIPRAEAVPVPAPVRAIATEARTAPATAPQPTQATTPQATPPNAPAAADTPAGTASAPDAATAPDAAARARQNSATAPASPGAKDAGKVDAAREADKPGTKDAAQTAPKLSLIHI